MAPLGLTSEEVELAFRLILGRSPESAATVNHFRALQSSNQLRDILFSSRESLIQSWCRLIDHQASVDDREYQAAGSINLEHSEKMIIIQSCDNQKYLSMLQITSQTIFAFVENKTIEYELFVGLKRGSYPHHATFNRIYKLHEYIEMKRRGWVLYLDADAYINDLNFDVMGFLKKHDESAFIFARINDSLDCPYWNVNAGVFFANLSHPICVSIIRQWKNFYDLFFSREDYRVAKNWDDVINDQTSLHQILRCNAYKTYINSLPEFQKLINHPQGAFIRQVLRNDHTSIDDASFENRLRIIRSDVTRITGNRSI